jgi:putative FmdB family regulatory protein
MPIYEYRCVGCGSLKEQFVHQRPRPAMIPCECGAQAVFQISAPHFDLRMGIKADAFPTMGDRWAKAHTDQLKKEMEHG